MDPIKALLFDKDGTLFDFQATWGVWAYDFLRALATDDHELTALHDVLAYDPDKKAFQPSSVAVAGTPDDIVEKILPILTTYDHDTLLELITQSSMKAPLAPAVPLDPLLRDLRAKGYYLGVATNDVEATARANLAQTGVDHFFDFIIGFDSGPTPKPAPDMVLAFAQHLGLPAAQVAMIGDSTHDLHAGRAAGATTVGVLTGTAKTKDLAPFADVVLPNIGHLPEWLSTRTS